MIVGHDIAVNVLPHLTLNSGWDNVGNSVSLRRSGQKKAGDLQQLDLGPRVVRGAK